MNGARARLAAAAGGIALAAAIVIPASAAAGPGPAPVRLAPVRVAPARIAPGRDAPGRIRPGQVTPGPIMSGQVTPEQVAAGQGAPARTMSAWMPSAQATAALAGPPAARRPALVAEPDFSAPVTARVRCGTFTGTVRHGGDGSVLFPAFIAVTGRVSSTCGVTVTARVGYELDFVHQGPFVLGKAGPHQTVTIRRLHRQTRLATSFQRIFIQVCSGTRRLLCGPAVHV